MNPRTASCSLLFAALVVLCGPISNAAENEEIGELSIYDQATQIGTVANRIFRDANGRVVKKIYYRSSPMEMRGPYQEEDLQPYEVVTSEYDENGRLKLEKHLGPDMVPPWFRFSAIAASFTKPGALMRLQEVEYSGARTTNRWRRADGTREYEIRKESGVGTSHLYFDNTGQNLVAINGAVPSGPELSGGWGRDVDGVACGIGLNRSEGRLEDLEFHVTVRNGTASPRKVITCLPYHELQVELRDDAGKLVSQDIGHIQTHDQEMIRMNRGVHESTQTLPPNEAATYEGGHTLKDWYSNLPAGTYSLTVRRRADGPDFSLKSKPVKLQIIAGK